MNHADRLMWRMPAEADAMDQEQLQDQRVMALVTPEALQAVKLKPCMLRALRRLCTVIGRAAGYLLAGSALGSALIVSM
jgi:hypothetical protein